MLMWLMRLKTRFLFLAGVLAALPALAVASDIYGFVDNEGVSHFSNVPDSSRYKLVLRNREDYVAKSDERYHLRSTTVDTGPFAGLIAHAAMSTRLDPMLVHAVIATESGYNARALSPKGAIGLMQLMPETAKRYRVTDLYQPEGNIRAGTRYLSDLLSMFGGDISLALAAYNAGENAVLRYGRKIPPFAETQDYVPRVLRKYEELKHPKPAVKPPRA